MHYKANPDIWVDVRPDDRVGDFDVNRKKAQEFFDNNPTERIEKDIGSIVDDTIFSCSEVAQALELLHRFKPLA